MQVEEFLEQSANCYPHKVALVCGDRRATYRQIEERSNRLAHALMREGVERGDRVAVCLENGVEAVLAIFAILKAGAVFLVINPTTKGEKLAYVLNDCRASALITDAQRLSRLSDRLGQLPHLRCLCLSGPDGSRWTQEGKHLIHLQDVVHNTDLPSRPPIKKCIDIDLAALVYTSGSTGRPKGVMLTHLNIVSAATSITTYLENTPDDIILNVLPLAFDYGLYQLLMAFKIGGRLVLEPSFAYPAAVLDRLARERVTGFPIVPTVAAILLQLTLGNHDLSSLRYITNTGAALPTQHIRQLRALVPHARIYSMYGLTECKRVSYLPPDQIEVRPGSVGRGMPNEEVYLVDESGARGGPGMTGELVVRGSNVMKGYWERPEETERVLRPGPLPNERVLHTGDLFRMDAEGFLYFIGRKDDIIKSRGEKISPKEVEDVLYSLDGVQEAAVVGVPDTILGQAIKAVVTLRPGARLTENDLRRHCAQHLEDFMVPKFVEFKDSLPKTATGKINRRELMAAGGVQP